MADPAAPVRVAACGCITPFGDAAATHAALLRGECALRPVPVLGREGGDAVPLALLPGRSLDETTPPDWVAAIASLRRSIPAGDWGSAGLPVFVTGSNFGVGGLYALRRTGNPSFADWSALPTCTERVRTELGWGPDVSIVSHACVSAHLGLLLATRVISEGLADGALVLSFDFLSPFVAGGFHALKILNADFPSPYRVRDSGAIGLGDGAGFAVLGRGSGDWILSGQSVFNEMHHFTANRSDGSGFARCLGTVASAARGRRVWFKGHGTGTLEAGQLEVGAAARAFPEAPIVGWKGSLGHTLGSCGLVELAIAVESVRAGRTPGTIGGAGRAMADTVALESFGNGSFDGVVCASNAFGGAHAAFLLCHA
ncbi:MAG TPA: beta-ketoacyl synthase N-terminal-like domain-containing protein [Opitutaceae bacterium]|nr:beta-ketoacyl synthase N-terminal-like domain-containing protein [Opitutaceae bacterium]